MADELGEIAVSIKEDGAQEAADQIADAAGEGDGGGLAGGGDGGDGGALGGMLGGISAKLAGILGFVTFLASLKPIQELIAGLQRLFSVAILPLVALLLTFLRPLLQELLKFIGSIDFQTTLDEFTRKLDNLVAGLIRDFRGFIDNLIPFVNIDEEKPQTNNVNQFTQVSPENSSEVREGPFGTTVAKDSVGENIFIQMGWLSEKSATSQDQSIGETASSEVRNGGPGGT